MLVNLPVSVIDGNLLETDRPVLIDRNYLRKKLSDRSGMGWILQTPKPTVFCLTRLCRKKNIVEIYHGFLINRSRIINCYFSFFFSVVQRPFSIM